MLKYCFKCIICSPLSMTNSSVLKRNLRKLQELLYKGCSDFDSNLIKKEIKNH